jgi:methylmalonyl-CoA/ethylmalonyl-CoA epimerase
MFKSNWKFHHVAVVIKDMEKAIKYYQSMGLELMAPPVLRTWGGEGVKVYGKTMDPPMQFNFCLLKKDKFIIELFQTIGNCYIWSEFEKEHGEGIQHLHFDVDDLEKETAEMVAKGFKVIFSLQMPDGSLRECFFDTRAYGNVLIALYSNIPAPRFPGYITPEQSAKLREEMA